MVCTPLAAGIAPLSRGSYPAGPQHLLAVSRGVDRCRSNAVAEHLHASLSAWPWLRDSWAPGFSLGRRRTSGARQVPSSLPRRPRARSFSPAS